MTSDNARRDRAEEQDSVKVCIRIRPLSSKEKQEQTKSCIRIAASMDGLSSSHVKSRSSEPKQLIVGKDRAFTFDNILGVTSSQSETYRQCVEPLVQGFLEGYNATVLAYGQTGTGKTHTMAGSGFDARGSSKNSDLQGIIPRVIKAVFKKLKEIESHDNQGRSEYTLRVEYVEIYNEELRDLLHPETTSKQLAIREDGDGNIIIAGVKSELAETKEAVFRHLVVGGSSRATGSTLMNEQSSRSHAIFSLILDQRDVASGARRFSKFHLVDLAGSERAKRTGAVAGRFKESVSINQGLLALGNVISALGDDKRRVGTAGNGSNAGHVPYRDSKLTRLLQDSLGGNSRTLMIACVSPAAVNFEETLNTLKYANRAKKIKNKPIVNRQVISDDERQRNDAEISRMKEEIANLQSRLQQQPQSTPQSSRPSSSIGTKRQKIKENDQDLAVVNQELAQATKCIHLYGDAVESIRTYSMEAATMLVAMEREIKSLGRPVQQRLNEIVKLLNASIQTANVSDTSAAKLMARRQLDGENNSGRKSGSEALLEEGAVVVKRLRQELKEAKENLTRDEQIFEMKNNDMKRLQALLVEAKEKNEKLIGRVQELECGGSKLSNSRGPGSSSSTKRNQEITMRDLDTPDRPRGRSRTPSPLSSTQITMRDLDTPDRARGRSKTPSRSARPSSTQITMRDLDTPDATSRGRSRTPSRSAGPSSTRDFGTSDRSRARSKTPSRIARPSSTQITMRDLGSPDTAPRGRSRTPSRSARPSSTQITMRDLESPDTTSRGRSRTPSRSARPSSTPVIKTSSRGLFSGRRSGLYEGNEDKVIMGHPEDDDNGGRPKTSSAIGFKRHSDNSGEDENRSSLSSSRLKRTETILQVEDTIAKLQTKLEELQKKNEQLLDAREESSRRWVLERQNYERQLSEAEHKIELLKRENQALEDSTLDEKQSNVKEQALTNSPSRPSPESATASVERQGLGTASSSKASRPPTASKSQNNGPIDEETIASVFESSVQQLIEYRAARREVLHLLKGKKKAEQSRSEAARRVNALEMQKMRQSLGVRERISDVSESLHALDERMQAENRSLIELERLKKLRLRADQKLNALRKQEEQAEFLDSEAKQELQDLEELLVDLDSHIAFQDAELEAARNDLRAIKQKSDSVDAKSPLDGLATEFVQKLGLGGGNAAVVISKFLGEVASLRIRVRAMGSEVQELQSLVSEREAALGQLESGLAVARDEFDRRLAVQRQESALAIEQVKKMHPQVLVQADKEGDDQKDAEWQKLIVRCQKKDEYIADLEKHLVFYKSKSKQMQAQLQQLIRSSSEQQRPCEDADDEQIQRLQRRVQQLEDANDALMQDLASAKVYLRASQSRGTISKSSGGRETPKVVRVSKSELRELPAPMPSHVADQ